MEAYRHTVQYYETDQMGITHHSNYIRFMMRQLLLMPRKI